MDQMSPRAPEGPEQEKAIQPESISEASPEVPQKKSELEVSKTPEIVVEIPPKEETEEKTSPPAKQEDLGNLEIGDIEGDINTVEQASDLLEKVKRLSQES